MEIAGTAQQALVYLNMHWGRRYRFAPPHAPGSPWTATARFGRGDRLRAESASALLVQVRAHYQAHRPGNGKANGC